MPSAVRSRPAAPTASLPTAAGAIALLGMACRAVAQQAQPAVEAAPSGVVALVGNLAQRLPGLWGSLPGIMVALGAVLMLQRMMASSAKPKAHKLPPIPEEEVDRRCAAWVPAPPVPYSLEEYRQTAVIEGYEGSYALLHGGPVPKALHLAHTNYLNLSGDSDFQARCLETVDVYGVGLGGARGFYGTTPLHLELESLLAQFFGTEAAIAYPYDLITAASIIPAFASREDIVVMDERVSYAMQCGSTISRARVVTFKHNDVVDLERVLRKLEADEKAGGGHGKKTNKSSPLCRKMIVVEGVYGNYGDVAPLAEIVQLKERYKYRLLVDESHGVGVLGATGRGACEAAGLAPGVVDIIIGSLSNTLGTMGGFCVADKSTCDYQRLMGPGYTFTTSPPPYLMAAGVQGMRKLLAGSGCPRMASLAANTRQLRSGLQDAAPQLLHVYGGVESPAALIHMHLAQPSGDRNRDTATLQRVADHCLAEGGVLVAVPRYSYLDQHAAPPSIMLAANAGLSEQEVAAAVAAVGAAARAVLKA